MKIKFIVITLFFSFLFSQTSDNKLINDEFIYLNNKIKKLEQRLDKLENKKTSSSSNNFNQQQNNQRQNNVNPWRLLKKGMSQKQVRELLGEPYKVDVYQYIDDKWKYRNGGSVKFDKNGRVTSWFE